MYAVIASGGKQYKVTEGATIKVATLNGEPGAQVEFDQVLLLSNDEDVKIGTPYLDSAKVFGEIVLHGKEKKIEIIKFKRRKHHLKHQGHRQQFTSVKITSLDGKPAVQAEIQKQPETAKDSEE